MEKHELREPAVGWNLEVLEGGEHRVGLYGVAIGRGHIALRTMVGFTYFETGHMNPFNEIIGLDLIVPMIEREEDELKRFPGALYVELHGYGEESRPDGKGVYEILDYSMLGSHVGSEAEMAIRGTVNEWNRQKGFLQEKD